MMQSSETLTVLPSEAIIAKGKSVLKPLPSPRDRISLAYMEIRIAVIGGRAVGKSSLAVQYVSNTFVKDLESTVEESYQKMVNINGGSVLIKILDCAGQEEFSEVRDLHTRMADAFLLVYAINDRESFYQIQSYVEGIMRQRGSDWDLSEVPIVLVGNKTDLQSERRVSFIEGEQLAGIIGCSFFETR
eukprot:GEZU01013449.1.p1 GENE.GEZU01013449.1~~GEZU01013449.1.p1  ORF type:complete len:188 (-),score=21.64 GEZU01013449.1:14-577(-)